MGFFLCVCFLFYFSVSILFVSFKERKKGHGAGRVGRWGGSGKSWERGKAWLEYIAWKQIFSIKKYISVPKEVTKHRSKYPEKCPVFCRYRLDSCHYFLYNILCWEKNLGRAGKSAEDQRVSEGLHVFPWPSQRLFPLLFDVWWFTWFRFYYLLHLIV